MIHLVLLDTVILVVLSTVSLTNIFVAANLNDPIEGRYSFSLTTFHPSGSLPQLNSACLAVRLGPPIVAFSLLNGDGIVLASVQKVPSALVNEDGTARFVQVSDSIAMGHTGVSADGRLLCAAAQRLAVEHQYSFEEEIPIDTFLEETSLLFQRYTMKPGTRPFGCSLIVAYLGSKNSSKRGKVFTIDPSGNVSFWEEGIAFIGSGDGDNILCRLRELDSQNSMHLDDSILSLSKILRDEKCVRNDLLQAHRVLCACFCRQGLFLTKM